HVETPQGEDINSLLDGHEPEILTDLLGNRRSIEAQDKAFVFSTESKTTESSAEKKKETKPELDTQNPHNIKYTGQVADYYIKGGVKGNLDSLKVSLQIVHRESRHDYRGKA